MKDFIVLLVSLCFTELIHNMLEIWGMRQKVEWLRLILDKKEHGRWPINIDTKLKTAVLHALMLILTTAVGSFVLTYLNLTDKFLLVIGIVVLLVNYILTTWSVDKFHSEIGKLIRKVRVR
jgi:hypothetical protein